MAQRGRKPKPTPLKLLEGNPGKRPLPKGEVRLASKAPRCPQWLEEDAKKEWKRMGKILEQMGILTEMDMTAFAGYCQAYARWKEAEEFLSKHGSIIKTPNGYLQQVPQVSISQTNLKILLKFCEQFGLTPSARNRLATMDVEVGTGNEMEDLLGGILLVIIMNQVHSCFQPHTMIRQMPIGQ